MGAPETDTVPTPERYGEMHDAAGGVRPHWSALAAALTAVGPEEYARRHDAAQAMIRDNGVTYNVYDDADGQARPWQLDILPLAISAQDWRIIEAGIVQRATLANALLADIYGAQKLIAGGHLPPHLVLGHPQFLRPLMGVAPPNGVHVHLYSADLARAADGSWRILSSRGDAPSGIGYALENRIVVGQTFPELFGEMGIRRLASFFNAHREQVLLLSQGRKGRAVLLTPGPHNEAYFEHAYLAHYLGLTLVEGIDMTVRGGEVFLKTLAGLERVAVIFRRVDSDFCDPLELRGDSALGIPGLVDVVRAGGVVLANALGGGVVESPAMDAYLPALARAVLGEELKLPDIPTVWCGTEWGRKEALARLDRVIVRDAFDARPLFSRASSARLGGELSLPEVLVLKERLARRGATVVTQDAVPLGLAPVYEGGRIGARPVSLRVFAAWTQQGYRVMPGGLTRVAPDNQGRALSMQSGASSKDTWIAGDGGVDSFSLLPQTDRLEIRRVGEAPTSRAMDNLFWLGRYAERAENLVRTLRAIAQRLADGGVTQLTEPLLRPIAGAGLAPPASGGGEARLAKTLRTLLHDRRSVNGLPQLLSRMRRTAWSARDRLSLDTWRTIHGFTEADALPDAARAFDPAEMITDLDALIREAAAFAGQCAENMTRGPNWLCVDLGRRIERAAHLAALIRQVSASSDELETERIRMALEIADSAMTYRSRYMGQMQIAPLVDLLLLDASNPRAAAFQFEAIEAHLHELPRKTDGQRRGLANGIVTEMRARLAAAQADDICATEVGGQRGPLSAFTQDIETATSRVTDAITDAYFQHAVRHRTDAARREAV